MKLEDYDAIISLFVCIGKPDEAREIAKCIDKMPLTAEPKLSRALFQATIHGHNDLVEILIKKGADVKDGFCYGQIYKAGSIKHECSLIKNTSYIQEKS